MRTPLARQLAASAYDWLLLSAILFFAAVPVVLWRETAIDSGNHLFNTYLLVWCYFYFCWQWRHGGQTLGMRAWRIRLQNLDNSHPGWTAVSRRFAAAMLSVLGLGVGYLWVFIDKDGLCLHDRLSGTVLEVLPRNR